MQKLRVSIAVVVHNEAKNICALLDSIAAIDTSMVAEVLVVDNASTDETDVLVQQWQKTHQSLKVRRLFRSVNHMAEARNLAIAESVSPWIYFTDGDCRLTKHAWQKATRCVSNFTKDEKVAAIGGGNIPPFSTTIVSQGLKAMGQNWWGHMGSIQMTPPQNVQQVELLSTCNLFINTEWARRCGGFDSFYSRVGEDLSLCHRLKKEGALLWAIPGIEVIHEQDRGLFNWCRKVFFYGKAQIDVAARYPRHFAGRRGLQFLFLGILSAITFMQAQLLLFLLAGYLVLVLRGFARSSLSWRERTTGTLFIMMSQAVYAVGELSGTLFLLLRTFLIFPSNIPVLDKAKNIIRPGHS